MKRSIFPALALNIALIVLACTASGVRAGLGRIEASFDVPGVQGNPFDFVQNDVQVTIRQPGGNVTLPAFYDGSTWRVRHLPKSAGRYEIVSIQRNGVIVTPKSIQPRTFDITEFSKAGYIRIDPQNKFRFIHDDGSLYYPLGFNHAWRNKGEPPKPSIPETMAKMHTVGANWIRIWMNHWDLKNLDWREDKLIEPGTFDMDVAKQWDDILAAAEDNAVAIQLTLQHHGQVSTRADPNWQINPWNKANGGWLESAEDFFTDEKVRALTKAKYRYIIARYGYSPAIMSWELFNEVEGTDAYRSNQPAVFDWHQKMAAFLREQDPYHHLISTSSRTTDAELWTAMDYYNAHVYAPDIVTAIQSLESERLDRAYFYGEIGSAAFGSQSNPTQTLHDCLWASLMSQSSGAAQYWYWDLIEDQDLFSQFGAASTFLTQSRLLSFQTLTPIEVVAKTDKRTALRFGPGTGWGASRTTHFEARPTGFVDGVGGMSAYLQGTLNEKNKPMFPFMELKVNFAQSGKLSIAVDEITQSGAQIDVSVDGKPTASLTLLPPSAQHDQDAPQQHNVRVNAELSVPVGAGEHVVRIENNGRDWVHLRQFTLDDYAPQLAVLGKGNSQFATMWIYRREPGDSPVEGTLSVPDLAKGDYSAVFFDTDSGSVLRKQNVTSDGKTLSFPTGPLKTDVAVWIEPASATPATQPTTRSFKTR